MRAALHDILGEPWARMEPIRLGAGHGPADRFVIVESDAGPVLRLDLYRSAGECFAFEEVCVWAGRVVVGWGHRLYLVEPHCRAVSALDLGSYFGHLYPGEAYLLAASAERLFRVAPDGSVSWRSAPVGLDGVLVDRVAGGVVWGRGEWDPPGGWKAFRVGLESGTLLSPS
jgi:hypothetical protein